MHELEHVVVGSGPAIVVVHGTNSSAMQTWGASVDALAQEHTLIMPALPGSGTSPLPEGSLDAEMIAKQLAHTAQAAGFDEFAIAGASLGAPLALKTAALFPENVTHVITLCGYAKARPSLRMRLELWERLLGREPEVIGRLLLILGMPDATAAAMPGGQLEHMMSALGAHTEPGMREQIELARTIDVEADLPKITVPTLVISAAQDNFVDPAHSARIAESVAGSALLELNGSHGLAHEDPESIANAVHRLIRS